MDFAYVSVDQSCVVAHSFDELAVAHLDQSHTFIAALYAARRIEVGASRLL